ncbi:MAG TPA: sigma-54 dependent transcriptional regulator [Geobacteraceae bacterium]
MQEELAEKPRILIIDDDHNLRRTLVDILKLKGYSSVAVGNGAEGLAYLQESPTDVVLIDLTLPDIPGGLILERVKSAHPLTQAIILTGDTTVETAVECMKEGACDYLAKPMESKKLFASIARALEIRSLQDEVISAQQTPMPERLANESDFAAIVTGNKQMREIFRYIDIIAVSRQPVLITGETGVGKELFARAIHRVSKCSGAFVAVNVAGLDDLMFSDTLFGHKKGSYTGASDIREGLVGKASDGTLFLDEIGDLAENSQTKLLRLIQEQEYYRLGSDTPIKSSARLVIATNRDLRAMIQAGRFRKDLFYRLCTHQCDIPPLRDRLDDIPILLAHFIEMAARSMGKGVPSYPRELVTLLSTYEFPGNVRELQAIVFDIVARTNSRKLSLDWFKEIIRREREDTSLAKGAGASLERNKGNAISFSHFPTLKEAETELINRALEIAKGNQGVAASLLGITRQALNNRLRRAG